MTRGVEIKKKPIHESLTYNLEIDIILFTDTFHLLQ
jgi:hypothetical protein